MSETPKSYQVGGSHYTDMTIQPWDAMEEWMSEEQYIGYLKGCALKYLARAGKKGPRLEDYKKAAHYLSEMYRAASESHGENSVCGFYLGELEFMADLMELEQYSGYLLGMAIRWLASMADDVCWAAYAAKRYVEELCHVTEDLNHG